MSAELQAALTKLVEGLLATAEKAGQVGQEQLPLVIQEYLAWGIWRAALTLGTLWVIAGWLLWVGRYISRTPGGPCIAEYCQDRSEGRPCERHMRVRDVFGSVIFRVVALIPFGIGGIEAATIIKIYVAPRVYLIDQLRGML